MKEARTRIEIQVEMQTEPKRMQTWKQKNKEK